MEGRSMREERNRYIRSERKRWGRLIMVHGHASVYIGNVEREGAEKETVGKMELELDS